MISAIKEIGEIALKQEGRDGNDLLKNPIDAIVENPNVDKVLSVMFDCQANYDKVELSDFDVGKYRIYLYRKGSTNGSDITPTSKIASNNIKDVLEKTWDKKIFKWFKDNKDKNETFNKLYNEIFKSENKIKEDIKKTLSDINLSKTSLIMTVKLDDKFIGEIEEFRNFMVEDALSVEDKPSFSKEGVCSVCGERKDEVFTTSEIYTFYTLDKECYIASGFERKNAWKNFPICKECFLKIELGKKTIEEDLSFKFSGLSYYLIPEILTNPHDQAVEDILDIIKKSKDKKDFKDNEELVLELLSQFKDYITLYFLFLKKENSADRIQLLIEDVLPSRISKIVDAENKTNKLFKTEDGKDFFNFSLLYEFFQDKTNKFLFEVVDKIFRGGKLDRLVVYRKLLNALNNVYYEDNKSFLFKTLKSLSLVRFLEELGILKHGGDRTMTSHLEAKEYAQPQSGLNQTIEKRKFDEIYEKFKGLDTPTKRGIFLLGALTQWLLSLQAHERDGNMPFLKALKGLNMNMQDIKGLLPKVVDKFIAYNNRTPFVRELEKEISANFLAEQNPKIPIEEINFIFATGMALYDEVKSLLKEVHNSCYFL
ncbi:MAG: TIGR02556 family CRISPR-associated protein [Hydrogenobaculum sp.]